MVPENNWKIHDCICGCSDFVKAFLSVTSSYVCYRLWIKIFKTNTTLPPLGCSSVERASVLVFLKSHLPSIRSCRATLGLKSSGPFCGVTNSILHSGHCTLVSGILYLQRSWRHPRQNECPQSSTRGLLKSPKHIGQWKVVFSTSWGRNDVIFRWC